jgi:hypothetical protein
MNEPTIYDLHALNTDRPYVFSKIPENLFLAIRRMNGESMDDLEMRIEHFVNLSFLSPQLRLMVKNEIKAAIQNGVV